MTFCELFLEYIGNKEKIDLKTSSISTYTKIYNAQLHDYFSDIDVKDFNEQLISKFILELFDKGLNRRYIKSITNLLYAVINFAKFHHREYTELAYIQRKNIKVNKKKVQVFSEDEQNKMENYILSNITPVNIGILLCLFTGIRIGELCALTIDDVDIENKSLSIYKTMQRISDTAPNAKKKTKILVDTPKSENSIRVIPLPDFITPILKKLISGINKKAYLLTLSDSKFIEPRLMEYKFKEFLSIVGIPYKNFHVTRHTFANTMLDLNVDIKSLSEWLGHANVTITMNEYIHPSIERKQKYVHLLNKKFLSNHN